MSDVYTEEEFFKLIGVGTFVPETNTYVVSSRLLSQITRLPGFPTAAATADGTVYMKAEADVFINSYKEKAQ